jgi:hypothetical protein
MGCPFNQQTPSGKSDMTSPVRTQQRAGKNNCLNMDVYEDSNLGESMRNGQ